MPPPAAFLVRYGRPGFVGRFACDLPLARGDRVVLRGPRGVEFGEVLLALESTESEGEILRPATAGDETEAAAFDACGQELLAAASESAGDLPLAFVDVEVTLDGVAVLHALPWGECDATALLEELGRRFGLAARLLDLSRTPVPTEPAAAEKGCGKPGCGTASGGCSSCGTGGGCSTGSCSRGSVKTADELTAYFADLRTKMEAAGIARTPLN